MSSASSMSSSSRWDSHIGRAPTTSSLLTPPERGGGAAAASAAALQDHRLLSAAAATAAAVATAQVQQQNQHVSNGSNREQQKAPIRPQRRTSFEVDRSTSGNTLICNRSSGMDGSSSGMDDSSSGRRALSQSLTQLSTLQEGGIDVQEQLQQLCKKTLPPRAPIRRSSGRVHSPPPPDSHSRTMAMQFANSRRRGRDVGGDGHEEDNSGSFHLEFSGSDQNEDGGAGFHSRRRGSSPQQQQQQHPRDSLNGSASSTGSSSVVDDDTTPRRPASYEDRTKQQRSSSSSPNSHNDDNDDDDNANPKASPATSRRNRSPRRVRGSSSNTDPSNHARHRRTTDPDLPQLEGFSSQPHQRVLPRQDGTRHLIPTTLPPLQNTNTVNNSIGSNNNNDNIIATTTATTTNATNKEGHHHHHQSSSLANTYPYGDVASHTTELNLTKVASSKVLPGRRSLEMGDKKSLNSSGGGGSSNTGAGGGRVEEDLTLSPPTIQKAVKKTLLGRMKKSVKGKLIHANATIRGRSKSPVPLRKRTTAASAVDVAADNNSKSSSTSSSKTHTTLSTAGLSSLGGSTHSSS